MYTDNLHTIERFTLDADYYEVSSAKNTQSQITAVASSKLTEAFERVCNKYSEDVYYKMRRVYFDLGDIPVDMLESELIQRFENKLIGVLEAIKRGEHLFEGLEGLEIKTVEESLIEGVVYFLNHGVLPYHIQKLIGNRSVKDLLLELNEKKIPFFQKELRSSVTSLMAKRRIVRLFSGSELLQFFHLMMPDENGKELSQVYLELATVLKNHSCKSLVSSLELYCSEYFVDFVLQNENYTRDINRKLLLKGFFRKLEMENHIIHEKWMPELLNTYAQLSDHSNPKTLGVLSELINEYFNYLTIRNGVVSVLNEPDLLQKQSHKMELKETIMATDQEAVTDRVKSFLRLVVNEVKGIFKSVEADRIEIVIDNLSDEILPKNNISNSNIAYWSEALLNEINRIFGITIPNALSVIGKEQLAVESENTNIIQKRQLTENVSNSVSTAYWMMFLSAGPSPFSKLYTDPSIKLKSIFLDFIKEDPESAAWQIKQRVSQQNVMIISWWIKNTLGEELFAFYKSHLPYTLSIRIAEKMSYAYVITNFFFANGNFPWPELNYKGSDRLISEVNKFAEELDEYTLQELAIENGLFQNATRMEKVFSLVSISLAKKLMQVRQNLIESGKIDESINLENIGRQHDGLVRKDESTLKDSKIESGLLSDMSIDKKSDDSQFQKRTKEHNSGTAKEQTFTSDQKENESLLSDNEKNKRKEFKELDKQNPVLESQEIDSSPKPLEIDRNRDFETNEYQSQKGNEDIFDLNQFIANDVKRWEMLSVNELLNEIAHDIIHFKQVSYISLADLKTIYFKKIKTASERSFYQTAAMLVGIPQDAMNDFMKQLTNEQKDLIKKLVKNYRTRFVSMAEDIKRSEEELKHQGSNQIDENQSFFIQNAGMVLLNPYLIRLFKRFELIEGKDFVDEMAKEKGVFLLQYIVNKNTQPEEWELPLNKIICGLSLGVPIKNEVCITDEEKQVCDGLLEAMVKNWGALKNTSADGLRTSFLMRDGTLRKEAIGWKLQIEKKVYDILLEKLPWGYSMIQLPWMELPLNTEWEK
jgi:hypothetical protein